MQDSYDRLRQRLDAANVPYRVIDHPPEGRTAEVSAIRGHSVRQAAKCIILIVKLGKKTTRFVLAVVRGDGRVDFDRVKRLFGATYVGFASADVAERLAGSVSGTVLPFAMSGDVSLLVDPFLLAEEVFYFNAARLDRSLAMRPEDYLAVAQPQVATIASYDS